MLRLTDLLKELFTYYIKRPELIAVNKEFAELLMPFFKRPWESGRLKSKIECVNILTGKRVPIEWDMLLVCKEVSDGVPTHASVMPLKPSHFSTKGGFEYLVKHFDIFDNDSSTFGVADYYTERGDLQVAYLWSCAQTGLISTIPRPYFKGIKDPSMTILDSFMSYTMSDLGITLTKDREILSYSRGEPNTSLDILLAHLDYPRPDMSSIKLQVQLFINLRITRDLCLVPWTVKPYILKDLVINPEFFKYWVRDYKSFRFTHQLKTLTGRVSESKGRVLLCKVKTYGKVSIGLCYDTNENRPNRSCYYILLDTQQDWNSLELPCCIMKGGSIKPYWEGVSIWNNLDLNTPIEDTIW